MKKRPNGDISGLESLRKTNEMLEERKQELQKMLTSDEYILWLNKFTLIYENFKNDDWLYKQELSEFDRKNVLNISILYNIINQYAKKNYIYPVKFQVGNFYQIKYNDIGYQIGFIDGLGRNTYFCKRVKVDSDFLDFRFVQMNRELKNTKVIKMQLRELSDLIIRMSSKGIPSEALSETVEKSLQKIKKKY